MLQRPLPRFLAWVGFLLVVAILAVVVGLHGLSIALVEGLAWVVVAVVEFSLARPRSERRVVVPSIPALRPDPMSDGAPTVRVLGRDDDDDVSFEWMTDEIDNKLPDYMVGEPLPDLTTVELSAPADTVPAPSGESIQEVVEGAEARAPEPAAPAATESPRSRLCPISNPNPSPNRNPSLSL